MRYGFYVQVLLLVSATCACMPSQLLAQSSMSETVEVAFVLPKGLTKYTFSNTIPLALGTEAELLDIAFAKTQAGRAGEIPLDGIVSIGQPSVNVWLSARKPHLHLEVELSRQDTSIDIEVLARIQYRILPSKLSQRSGPTEPLTSVLSTGKIYKLAVDADGMYAIDADLLNKLGVSNAGGPPAVQLFSKGGAMLPERVGQEYPVDLMEVALLEQGNGDNKWDAGERLLFYGEGEDTWQWDSIGNRYNRLENLYSEHTYYYLKAGENGARIGSLASVAATDYSSSYSFRARWEEDKVNLLQYSQQNFNSGQGSGQPFYGDLLMANQEIVRPAIWDLGQIPPGATGRLDSEFWAASSNGSSVFTVNLDGQSFRSGSISSSTWRTANSPMAARGVISTSISLNAPKIDLSVYYPSSPDIQRGWPDYVQLNHPAVLSMRGDFLSFRSLNHSAAGNHGFSLGNASGVEVLDITNPFKPQRLSSAEQGGQLKFGYAHNRASQPREFVAFKSQAAFAKPQIIGQVSNSNLHAITRADMLIVYGDGLESPARRLAEHRRNSYGFAVEAVSIKDVLEEFGGGRPDPTAIRNLASMLYARDQKFRHLLLLGDGTYDPRQIIESVPPLIPTFQTKSSNWEVTAFPTDDYYALLDEGEGMVGEFYPVGGLDVSIGRIPAFRVSDANAVVDKIIRYDTDPKMLGDWRLRNVFVADDEDGNQHVLDVESVATKMERIFPQYNQTKVYVDAFEQLPTSGGPRFPAAAAEINRNMFRGNLITTYLGHGGPRGWGLERFLNAPDIEKWNAPNALPLIITATCTFTGFDDPQQVVIGEQVLFKRDGGVVASLSTTRPVYPGPNRDLTDAALETFLDRKLAREFSMGELLNVAKLGVESGLGNSRRFGLFGDPSLRLAVPRLDVVVTHIDSVAIDEQTAVPAIAPLREVRLRGKILGLDSALVNDFNGVIEFTVFDQNKRSKTLGQDPGSKVQSFEQVGPTLFAGSATVTNGNWEALFMLPVDVSLSRGQGRLSLYAKSNDGRDGAGVFTRFIIDGLAAPAVNDKEAPLVEVFIDSESFLEGGVSSEDPVLFAKLSDNTGINVSGTAIGHDLTATLRGPSETTYTINDFYKAATDDYRRGEVRYPVYDLPEGNYELEVRAWDLANNTGVGRTSFLVTSDAGQSLRHVLNYPNPFVDATCFQFEHALSGQQVEVRVDIYTTAGRLVKSIDYRGRADGSRFGSGDDCISWDGTDNFGQRLARGVYLYKVKLSSASLEKTAESGFERLVVLR